jgi:hypothetical protein
MVKLSEALILKKTNAAVLVRPACPMPLSLGVQCSRSHCARPATHMGGTTRRATPPARMRSAVQSRVSPGRTPPRGWC